MIELDKIPSLASIMGYNTEDDIPLAPKEESKFSIFDASPTLRAMTQEQQNNVFVEDIVNDPYARAVPSFVDPQGAEFGTSLDLNRQQLAAEKRAATEINRIRRRMQNVGQGKEFDDYLREQGNESLASSADYHGARLLTPIFDVLSSGNYATAGFVSELIRTGSAAEAFERAGVEFANAMPFYEKANAERTTFQDVFDENGIDYWGASATAFLLDVIADPINLIPGAVLAKTASKGAKTVGKATGLKGSAFGNWFDGIFRPEQKLKDIVGTKGEDVGTQVLRERDYAEAGIIEEFRPVMQRIERLTNNMAPAERVLIGLFFDQTNQVGSTVLKDNAKRLVDAGLMPVERLEKVQQTINEINKFHRDLFQKEKKWGLLDESTFQEGYLYRGGLVRPRLDKSYDQYMYDRGLPKRLPIESEQKASFMQQRGRKTTEQALRSILKGGSKSVPPELDVYNLLVHRGFEHARWIQSRKFMENVGNLEATLPNGNPFSTPLSPNFFDGSKEGTKAYNRLKRDLKEDGSGMAILERKRVVKNAETGEFEDRIEGGFVLPEEVVDHMNKADVALGRPEELTGFFNLANKIVSPWRAWATLSPGFHIRNFTGMVFMNWLRGVGAKEVNLSGRALGDVSFKLPTGTGLIKRHLQALQVQVASEGAGELPVWVAKGFNGIAKTLGYKDFASMPFPKIKVDGKVLSAAEVGKLAKQFDVPQTIGHMGPTGENINDYLWQTKMPKLTEEEVKSLAETQAKTKKGKPLAKGDALKAGLEIMERAERTGIGQKAINAHDWVVSGNRAAATIPENNGRIAMFIDRLAKGDSLDTAAAETKKWHFDYRKLSKVERQVFASMMPFYAWQRFALPRMMMAVIEDPARLAKVPKLQNAVENFVTESGYPTVPTPDYFEEIQAVQLPAMDEDGYPIFIAPDLPILELNKLNSKDFVSGLNPAIKIFFEDQAGKSFFTGAPLEKFPGEVDPDLRWLPGVDAPWNRVEKKTEQVASALFPPLGKYWLRPQRAVARGQEEYSAVRELGVNLRPVDVRRVLRGKNFENVKLARDFERRYKQQQALNNPNP
tara:strand:+ start:2576 stop:5773 length:3198 start_codon:yes stop_codon:yes gene_type:complete